MPHRYFTAVRLFWRKRYGVVPLRSSLARLTDWLDTPLGQRLIAREQALLDEQLPDLFGYHLMQLSVSSRLDLSRASRISHRFSIYPQAASDKISAVSDFNHLPLPPNSIDVILLHHVLDYSQSPHHVLRESASLLIPHGHVVIVGFNPWSLFGLWRWMARFVNPAPHWRHQALRLGRLLDWLKVLDFEPLVIKQGFYPPPLQGTGAGKYLQWLERWGKRLSLPCGGFYLIVACKHTVALTPIKPKWQSYPGLRAWGVTKILGPAARQPGQN